MQMFSVIGNTQRLDGGSMFGNCPRAVWERWATPDDHHRIELASRALLVREDSGRTVLFETGIGSFFEPKMRARYGVQESEHVLLSSLKSLGCPASEIDVVVLSHLHFDHAGGLLHPWRESEDRRLAFVNAHFVVSEDGWSRAQNPHPRDRASFIPELCGLLEKTGRVERVRSETSDVLGDGYRFSFSQGHTPGLMLTRIEGPCGPVTFLGDLVPGAPWVHLPITMGYDRYPELLIDEKSAMLERIIAEHGWAFFTHDPTICAGRIEKDARGRYRLVDEQTTLAWS